MSFFEETFSIKTQSKTSISKTVISGGVRISVITDRLIRVEKSAGGFCDLPTQAVWYRDFGEPEYTCASKGGLYIITTRNCTFAVNKTSGKTQYVKLGGRVVKNFKRGNLGGTRRTLDMTYGKVRIGKGIVSKNGVAVLDDKKSLVLNADGTLSPFEREKDYYVFAYDHDYRGAVSDFFELTGKPELLPKYVFGNWWSRYKAYTQQEYLDLMQRFDDENIPFSVATVDMDWHWVDVAGKFGKSAKNKNAPKNPSELVQGWTGYSWNTDLFPDYKEFLKKLKDTGHHITLNVHPSMGLRWFEDMYADFARFLGKDPDKKEQIDFDLTDKKFTEAYFKFLHHPYEKDGVDFWWIDWQQGKKTAVKGLDPLWVLNHYHYLDSKKDGRRPLILSRFAGAGSHRYPLGFSGDTAIYWSALRFQPYFTSTASNIGYGWWSHDIGGHRGGIHDNELYLRWLQFGVFSPVNRLHSSNNKLMGKEPWNYGEEVYPIACDFLRLRQRLIPYIYSMNYRQSFEGRAFIEPMYYEYPDDENAYKCRNQYLFGSELICAPITEKRNGKTGKAFCGVWLPDDGYTDIFTNTVYKKGSFKMARGLSSIPVLSKPGAIIPLDCHEKYSDLPCDEIEVLIFNGKGSFKMYDDDGISTDYKNGRFAVTDFSLNTDGENLDFEISVSGDLSFVPQRKYVLSFRNISDCGSVEVNGFQYIKSTENGFLQVILSDVLPQKNVKVCIKDFIPLKNTDKKELYLQAVTDYKGFNGVKSLLLKTELEGESTVLTPPALKNIIKEIKNIKS
ncbi:MAG: DUF5110 domain-containing protein [Clostridia bacterium]|nr:DUF5110 domain-containing protein [Clostridia bacterium]